MDGKVKCECRKIGSVRRPLSFFVTVNGMTSTVPTPIVSYLMRGQEATTTISLIIVLFLYSEYYNNITRY